MGLAANLAKACAVFGSATLVLAPPLPQTLLNSKTPQIKFDGEVSKGKTFQREIAENLVFRLTPSPGAPETGWNIEIVPKVQPESGEPVEFVWVATPPYHFFNQRYLDTSYGYTAAQAVAMDTREFNFVRDVPDFRSAAHAVDMVIYPNNASDQEMEKVKNEAAKVMTGSGELRILDSRTTPGKDEKDPGSIDWIRFQVELKLSSGVNMAQILELMPTSDKK